MRDTVSRESVLLKTRAYTRMATIGSARGGDQWGKLPTANAFAPIPLPSAPENGAHITYAKT